MKQTILLTILLSLPGLALADPYFELALEVGGETFATASGGSNFFSFDDDLNINGGVKFALGVQNSFGAGDRDSLSFAIGYLFDNIDADNGDAEFDTLTFDAIFLRRYEVHRLGGGISYHIGPEYEDDIDGFAPLELEFDDALGFLLQYAYAPGPGFQIGARFTFMEYESGGTDYDADSFGIFLSSGF